MKNASHLLFSSSRHVRWIVVFMFAALLHGCAQNTVVGEKKDFLTTVTSTASGPKKVIILEPDVNMYELSVGGARELVPAWSKEAEANVKTAIGAQFGALKAFSVVEPGALTDEMKAAVDEHLALFFHIAPSAFTIPRTPGDAWAHKKQNYDYTLGAGLKALGEKTGAQYALIAVAEDNVRSAGSQALVAAGVLAALALGVVIVPNAAPAMVAMALVELNTGDLTWVNAAANTSGANLRRAEDTTKLVEQMLSPLVVSLSNAAKPK